MAAKQNVPMVKINHGKISKITGTAEGISVQFAQLEFHEVSEIDPLSSITDEFSLLLKPVKLTKHTLTKLVEMSKQKEDLEIIIKGKQPQLIET